jgi:hypothetical protein
VVETISPLVSQSNVSFIVIGGVEYALAAEQPVTEPTDVETA